MSLQSPSLVQLQVSQSEQDFLINYVISVPIDSVFFQLWKQ